MVTICICSSVHGFRDDSVDLSVEEGSTVQRITITLNTKGNTLSEMQSTQVLSLVFQIDCLGSSSDVNTRVPGKALYSSMTFQLYIDILFTVPSEKKKFIQLI